MDSSGSTKIGSISVDPMNTINYGAGYSGNMFTAFDVKFPQDMAVNCKLLLLGAAIHINYLIYEGDAYSEGE